MQLSYYKTFEELADKYFGESLIQVEMSQRKALRAIGLHLRKKIREAYGVYGPGWRKSISSPSSPLVKTGGLKQSVSFSTTSNTVEVYSKKEWLAIIHEYGAVYKMTDKQRKFLFGVVFKDQAPIKGRPRSSWGTGMVTIPPRPIWRRIVAQEEKKILQICEDHYVNIFN